MGNIIYMIVVLIATTLGSLAGIGGGVIIKPTLDAIGIHGVLDIGVYSSVAVFSMAIISLFKQKKKGNSTENPHILFLVFGAIAGGLFGKYVLSLFTLALLIKGIQSILLGSLMVLILLYRFKVINIKSRNIDNKLAAFAAGLALGTLSSFLGIGGGPINVIFFVILFSMSLKQAAINSLTVIFFSQLSKLASMAIQGQFSNFDMSPVLFIVPAAILGGIIGTELSHKFDEDKIGLIYNSALMFVILINVYNAFNAFSQLLA